MRDFVTSGLGSEGDEWDELHNHHNDGSNMADGALKIFLIVLPCLSLYSFVWFSKIFHFLLKKTFPTSFWLLLMLILFGGEELLTKKLKSARNRSVRFAMNLVQWDGKKGPSCYATTYGDTRPVVYDCSSKFPAAIWCSVWNCNKVNNCWKWSVMVTMLTRTTTTMILRKQWYWLRYSDDYRNDDVPLMLIAAETMMIGLQTTKGSLFSPV